MEHIQAKVHQLFIFHKFGLQGHPTGQLHQRLRPDPLAAVSGYHREGRIVHSPADHQLRQKHLVHPGKGHIIHGTQVPVQRIVPGIVRVVFQNSPADPVAVLLPKGLHPGHLLEAVQGFHGDGLLLLHPAAGIKQKSRIRHPLCHAGSLVYLRIHQLLKVVIHRGRIPAALVVLKQDPGVRRIQPDIGRPVHAGIGFLHLKLPVADDHPPDLPVVTVQPPGKHHPGQLLRRLGRIGFPDAVLVNHRVILADFPFLQGLDREFLHGLPVAVIGAPVLAPVADHIGVDHGPLLAAEGIVIDKIHPDHLGQHLLIPLRHGFNIVFVQPGNPQIIFHRQGIPPEILRLLRLPLHDEFADIVHQILPGELLIAARQETVHRLFKTLYIFRQMADPQRQPLRQHTVIRRVIQRPHHKRRQPLQLVLILRKLPAGRQVQERTAAAQIRQLLHHIQPLCRRIFIFLIHREQAQQKRQAVGFHPVQRLHPVEGRLLLLGRQNPVKPRQRQVNALLFHLLPGKIHLPQRPQGGNTFRHIVTAFPDKRLVKLMLRQKTPGVFQSVQHFHGLVLPFLAGQLLLPELLIQTGQLQPGRLLGLSRIQLIILPPGGGHLKDHRLVDRFQQDSSKLLSFSQPVFHHQKIQTADASDEIVVGEHLLLHLQKIPFRLDVDPQIPPAVPQNLQGILQGALHPLHILTFLLQPDMHRFLPARGNEKLLHMLIGHRVSGHALVQAVKPAVRPRENLGKYLAGIQPESLPVIRSRQARELIQGADGSQGGMNLLRRHPHPDRQLILSQIAVDGDGLRDHGPRRQSAGIHHKGDTHRIAGKFFLSHHDSAAGGHNHPLDPAVILRADAELPAESLPLDHFPGDFPGGKHQRRHFIFKSSVYQLLHSSLQSITCFAFGLDEIYHVIILLVRAAKQGPDDLPTITNP